MKPKAAILYVNHASKISGAERCMIRILDDIDRDRFSPFLVCPDGDLAREAEARDTPVLRVDFIDYQRNRSVIFGRSVPNPLLAAVHGIQVISIGRRIRRMAERCNASLIHANTLLARVPAYVAGRSACLPVVWHIRDILSSRLWLGIYDLLPRRGVAGIISVSDACRGQFSDQSTITTVYDGIPGDVFCPQPQARLDLRKDFGWAESAVAFGIFGRITQWKGHAEFVDAAIEVHRHHPETRWIVVGEAWSQDDREFQAALAMKASQGGLADHLVFTGFRNDVARLMSACDGVVVPSIKPDPFPNTVLEGMACSRPVLAFPVGGIPEAIEDGVSGRLVAEMDASGLAAALRELIEDPNARNEMGKNARKRVLERFSPEKTQREIEAVYRSILGGSQGAP